MRELTRRRFWVPALAPRVPGWWLLATACAAGLVMGVLALAHAVQTFPVAAIVATVLTVPLIVGWWWLLRIPQLWARLPRSTTVWAALWGGLVGTCLFGLPSNGQLLTALGQHASISFSQNWGAALVAPVTEETGKAMVIAVILIASRQSLRTPLDGALLAAFSAVGFTATEDILYAFNIASLNLGENQVISTVFVYFLRAVIFGGVSHVVFSALVGAGIGWIATVPGGRRLVIGPLLIIGGAGLHFLWNSPLLASWWARIVYLIAVPFVVWFVLHRIRKVEHEWFLRTLSSHGALGDIPMSLLDTVKATWWARRKYRKAVVATYGFSALAPQRLAEATLTDLADAVAVGDVSAAAALRGALEAKVAATGAAGATTAP